jgi:hypothetical protein
MRYQPGPDLMPEKDRLQPEEPDQRRGPDPDEAYDDYRAEQDDRE